MDRKNRGNKILSCKTYLQVATFNAKILRTDDKRHELADNFNNCQLDILGITDHKVVLVQELGNCTLITTSLEKFK